MVMVMVVDVVVVVVIVGRAGGKRRLDNRSAVVVAAPVGEVFGDAVHAEHPEEGDQSQEQERTPEIWHRESP